MRGGTPGGSSGGALNLVIGILVVVVLVLLILVLGQSDSFSARRRTKRARKTSNSPNKRLRRTSSPRKSSRTNRKKKSPGPNLGRTRKISSPPKSRHPRNDPSPSTLQHNRSRRRLSRGEGPSSPRSRPFSRLFIRRFHSRNLGRPPILYHLETWRVSPSLTTGPATRRASYPEAPGARLIASLCRDDPGPRSFEKQERRPSEHMPQGRVKWYSAELGYGFILPYDGGTELLVRREDVSDGGFGSLEKSVEVTYEAVECREGPEAKNIHKA